MYDLTILKQVMNLPQGCRFRSSSNGTLQPELGALWKAPPQAWVQATCPTWLNLTMAC